MKWSQREMYTHTKKEQNPKQIEALKWEKDIKIRKVKKFINDISTNQEAMTLFIDQAKQQGVFKEPQSTKNAKMSEYRGLSSHGQKRSAFSRNMQNRNPRMNSTFYSTTDGS